MADETPLQVLQEPGRRAQTKSYMWLFRSGEDERRSSFLSIRNPVLLTLRLNFSRVLEDT